MSSRLNSKRQRTDMPKLDRRNFQRVKINVLGRYMLEDQKEYPCHIRDMSPGNLGLSGPASGAIGETVVIYVDHVGRLEGPTIRIFDGGFAVSVNAPQSKREKLSNQLTWLANRHELNLPEDRRHSREAPDTPYSSIIMQDGTEIQAKIIDMSLSGAAFTMSRPLRLGTSVMVGKIRARVVRVFEEGIAVEFAKVQANSDS